MIVLTGPYGGALIAGQDRGAGKPKAPASPKAHDKAPKERPAELADLIAGVQSNPPEFAADLLITIADSERVAESDWKKELLEQAFQVAADCEYQMPQRVVGPYPVDTRAGFLGEAFRLKLDTLSLRCRAIESMLRLDKAKARELFDEIDNFKFLPLDCDAGLVPDVSDFYKTAAKLFGAAYSLKEVERGENIRFLESLIDDISSPVQIPSVANLLRSLALSRDQRESLVTALAARIGKLSGDDRSFSSSVYATDDEIARLSHTCSEQGVSTIGLIRSLRSYYVKHLSASRCSDTLRNTGDRGPLPREVNQFNNRVRALTEGKVLEIEPEEVKPSKIEGKVETHFYWESPRAKKLMQTFKRLKFGSARTPLTPAERDTAEWRSDFNEFFNQLLAWDKNDENSVEDYFHQKCGMFEALMTIQLGAAERDEVIEKFVPFLCRFDVKSMSRIEWFWHAKNLLPRTLSHDVGESSANRRAVLEFSNNPVLYAYAQVWKTVSIQKPESGNSQKATNSLPPH